MPRRLMRTPLQARSSLETSWARSSPAPPCMTIQLIVEGYDESTRIACSFAPLHRGRASLGDKARGRFAVRARNWRVKKTYRSLYALSLNSLHAAQFLFCLTAIQSVPLNLGLVYRPELPRHLRPCPAEWLLHAQSMKPASWLPSNLYAATGTFATTRNHFPNRRNTAGPKRNPIVLR